MTTAIHERSTESSVAFVARKVGIGAIFVGIVIGMAWWFGVENLTQIRPGLPTVKTTTAICLVLFGAALYTYEPSGRRRLAAGVLGGLVAVICMATLTQSMIGRSTWIDRLLSLGASHVDAVEAARMSVSTALGMGALGVAMVLLVIGRRVSSQTTAGVAIAISGIALIGYLYDATSLYAVGELSTMPYVTAIGLQVLGQGMLLLIPGGVSEMLLRGSGGGSLLLRIMLPTVVLGLPFAGLIAFAGVTYGLYSIQIAFAILIVVAVFVLTGITIWASRSLDEADEELQGTLSELLDTNATLESRVSERTERLAALNRDLKESEGQYRSLVETSPFGIFQLDAKGVATFVNGQLAAILGIPKSDLLGPWDPKTAFQQKVEMPQGLSRLLAVRGGPEIQWKRPDGETRHLRVRMRDTWNPDGLPAGKVGMVSDITDEVTSRAALTQAQEQLRLSFEHAPIGKALVSFPDMRFIRVNGALCSILGADRSSDLVDRALAEFVSDADTEDWRNAVISGINQYGSVTWEQALRCKKGSKKWALLYLSKVNDPSGVSAQGVLQMVDATDERIRTRGAELLNDVLTEVHLDLDLDGMLDRAVSAVANVFHASRVGIRFLRDAGPLSAQWAAEGVRTLDERELQGALDLAVADASEGVAKSYDDVFQNHNIPSALRDEAQRLSIRSVLTIPIRRGNNLLAALVVAHSQAHEWTGQEIALAERIAENVSTALWNADLLAKEKSLASSLLELDTAKSDFVSSVSHELRTPLTSINGYLELIADEDFGALNDRQRKMLGVVQRNGVRLLELVEDLLTLAKIESGELASEMEIVDVPHLLREVLAVTEPGVTERSLRLDVRVSDSLPRLRADKSQLERVFLNLLSNAVKFTPPGGSVTVAAEAHGKWVDIAITDTGIGIPADEQKQLFTRFFRASSAQHRAIQGTGLGLAIVKMIVDNHNGEIIVESEENRGTTFRVRLPALPARVPQPVSV